MTYRLELNTDDLHLVAGEPITEAQITVISAVIERATLLADTAARRISDLESLARQYQGELAHIEQVYRLRLEEAQAEPDDTDPDFVEPDPDNDGFVALDRGGYWARIFGKDLTRRGRGFPTTDIAIYELARAMAEAGEFPNAWMEGEHGPSVRDINDEVRRFHDEGGSKLLPLEGVQYAPGDEIDSSEEPGLYFTVDQDYGMLGIVAHASGDPSVRQYVSHGNRAKWRKIEGPSLDEALSVFNGG
jgi:hypothetical protein